MNGSAEGMHVGQSPGPRPRIRRVLEIVLALATVAALFGVALPRLTGAEYNEVWEAFGLLSMRDISVVAAVWLLVMWTYTYVLVASLPGLRNTQALVVNVAGSALSNVVPFGGAAGVGATYAMSRSWGFDASSITRSIIVSGFWNVFAKLTIPVAAVALLTLSGQVTGELLIASVIGLATLAVIVTVAGLALRSEGIARWIGRLGERAGSLILMSLRRPTVGDIGDRLARFRNESISLIKTRWVRLSVWMTIYTLGQFAILLLCVRMLGEATASLSWVEIFAAFAFNRLLTTIPLTPSGVGFAETGTVALLTAFGAASSPATAAVLLYSAFTYLLEIPLGAVGWCTWASLKRWRRPVGGAGT